jgi:DNA-binding NarL/FixJ family response regulator
MNRISNKTTIRETGTSQSRQEGSMSISIVLADDHPVVRRGLQAVLEQEPDFSIVGVAFDGLEAVRVTERLKPDVIVLDLMMPGLSGLEVLRILRERSQRT